MAAASNLTSWRRNHVLVGLTMNVPSLPVSSLIRSNDEPETSDKRQSREEWRKQKELEEARKAGTAPAAVDEEGKDINPHIPQYISSAPWYIGSRGPTLKHQRARSSEEKGSLVNAYYDRGLTSTRANKWRKGACENCGAMTHKRKDCLERPRAKLAKYTNEDIAPDEKLVGDLPLDYDGKRDRWAGFDPSTYKAVVEEYEQVEEAKRKLKETRGPDAEDSDDDEDADKYADHIDMPGTKVDSKQRITVRNLRIREDTAKYLRNLDPESAYYDPKTRSMRDDPYKNSNKRAPDEFTGENFVRFTGDTLSAYEAQKFAWTASEKGVDVHLNAEPTRAELVHKQFKEKSTEIKDSVKKSIIDKYGNEAAEAPPELRSQQSEVYIEYSRSGKPIKGVAKPTVRSVYEEDVFINNHTSVWGSFWKDFRWGYKCCHSFIKNSYCTGEVGKVDNFSSKSSSATLTSTATSTSGTTSNLPGKPNIANSSKAEERVKFKSSADGNNANEPDVKKLKASKSDVGEAELEEFHMNKRRDGDPVGWKCVWVKKEKVKEKKEWKSEPLNWQLYIQNNRALNITAVCVFLCSFLQLQTCVLCRWKLHLNTDCESPSYSDLWVRRTSFCWSTGKKDKAKVQPSFFREYKSEFVSESETSERALQIKWPGWAGKEEKSCRKFLQLLTREREREGESVSEKRGSQFVLSQSTTKQATGFVLDFTKFPFVIHYFISVIQWLMQLSKYAMSTWPSVSKLLGPPSPSSTRPASLYHEAPFTAF